MDQAKIEEHGNALYEALRARQRSPRIARINHVVDHRQRRSPVDRDVLPQLGGHLLLHLVPRDRIFDALQQLARRDRHHPFRAHHSDLRLRPRDQQVGLVGPPVHHVVAGAVNNLQR